MKTLAKLALLTALLASAACAGSTASTAGGADPVTSGRVPGPASATSAGGGVAGMGGISGAR